MDVIDLAHDEWRVTIAPGLGGSILSCHYKGQAILREVTARQNLSPLDAACFPLVPFSNRIEKGQFSYDGQDIKLPPNMDGEPHAIHGYGWQSIWRTEEHRPDRYVMTYHHDPKNWPWLFKSTQTITLRGHTMSVELSLQNTDQTSMPAGLGLHPYFPNLRDASLKFKSQGVWTCAADCLPTKWIETPKAWDFSVSKPLEGLTVDHCFTGWDGEAEIMWAGAPRRVNIQSTHQTPFAVLYTHQEDDYFCFEPASHMNNGVNWNAGPHKTGVQILAPGETMKIEMHITAAQMRGDS